MTVGPALTVLTPTGALGYGDNLNWISGLTGPLPSGSAHQLALFRDVEKQFVVGELTVPTTSANTTFHIGDTSQQWLPFKQGISEGDQATVQASTINPDFTTAVTLTIQAPWRRGIQEPEMILSNIKAAQGGGLTDAQAQQLTNIESAAVPTLSIDGMGLSDLTGAAGAPELTVPLPSPVFGVIVRLTAVPDTLVPIQADPDYWRQTLARVSIFRGGDLWQRYPVHTQNRMFLFPGNEIAAGIAALPQGAWLLNMSLQLSTFPGVLAQVLIMHLP